MFLLSGIRNITNHINLKKFSSSMLFLEFFLSHTYLYKSNSHITHLSVIKHGIDISCLIFANSVFDTVIYIHYHSANWYVDVSKSGREQNISISINLSQVSILMILNREVQI